MITSSNSPTARGAGCGGVEDTPSIYSYLHSFENLHWRPKAALIILYSELQLGAKWTSSRISTCLSLPAWHCARSSTFPGLDLGPGRCPFDCSLFLVLAN